MKQRAELLEKIRKKLIERRVSLGKTLQNLSNEKVSDGQVQDIGDEALSVTMEKLQTSLEKTEINEIRLIDDALERIDKGEYGVCVDCGQPISNLRLETFPFAARCVACQEEKEEK